ncbi:MAG: response regulator [Magnetococcales bacterium]|nr:response regulator [Magnetococcales bacterium]
MSHEIRSPMNAIMGMTDLVLATNLTEEQKQYLTIVQQSTESLLALINDILDLSKIEADQLQLETTPFDLMEVLENVCDTLAVRAHSNNLDLILDLDLAVPTLLIGDPLRLRQILINLINNAIKFTKNGEVLIHVRLADIKPSEGNNPLQVPLHFTVSDTGIGIPADKIEAIFGKFTQTDASIARRYGGTGLGLSISRQLAQMMNGRMWAESAGLDQGSQFHFTAFCGVQLEMEKQTTITKNAIFDGVRVLVAETNWHAMNLLSRTISLCGAEVVAVKTAKEMFETWTAFQEGGKPFDVAIVDCHLPDFSQIPHETIANSMGKNGKQIIVMLRTGFRRYNMRGCKNYHEVATGLLKPIKQRDLLRAINQVLGRHEPAAFEKQINNQPESPIKKTVLTILLVEDQPNSQITIKTILDKDGHFVTTADNGLHGLQLLEKGEFDLIIADIQMPEMDGNQFTQKIRGGTLSYVAPDIPIIGVSANAFNEDSERSLSSGMNHFLPKPLRANSLLTLVQDVGKITIARNIERAEKKRALASTVLSVEAKTPQMAEELRLMIIQLSQDVTGLEQYLEGKDYKQVEVMAKNIKEHSAILGANRIRNEAIHIIHAVRRNDYKTLAEHQVNLRREFEQIMSRNASF